MSMFTLNNKCIIQSALVYTVRYTQDGGHRMFHRPLSIPNYISVPLSLIHISSSNHYNLPKITSPISSQY